jgi:hypothetical protein
VKLLHGSVKRFRGAEQKFQTFVNTHTSKLLIIHGGQGRIRTFVPRKEGQIYSLLALTTHPPVRMGTLIHR